MSHQYLTADWEEPIEIDGRYHVRVLKHGERIRFHVQGLNPQVVLSKPRKIVDKSDQPKETKGRTT